MYANSRMASTVLALLATTFVRDAMAAAVVTPRLERRASPTDLWVSVDGDGKPSTVTPVATTISGQPTVVSGAPNELTGTVFTITSMGEVRTSTGTTPLVTATAANGAGAFARCFNKDGEFAPLCTPNKNSSMFVGTQYYVTWDPDFFNQGNLTSDLTDVKVSAFFLNSTTNAPIGDRVDLSQQPVRGSLGFWTWKVDDSALAGQDQTNVTLLLLYGGTVGGGLVRNATGPTVLVQRVPQYHPPPTKAPVGPALYIGLPTVLGVVVIALFGTCIWNRRNRQIGLGNIMSRTRHGYGIGESRAKRMAKSVRRSVMPKGGRRGKDAGIQLDARGVPEQVYRDVPEEGAGRGRAAAPEGYSDDNFQNQAVGGGRNVFREEVRRQDRDMF